MSESAVREVSRGSFYLGLEQLTMMVGGVIYSMIILRMLGPATYAVLSIGQAAIGLASVLTTNIESYLERFVAELDARGMAGALRPLVRKVLTTKSLLAIGAGLMVVLLAGPIAGAYGYRDLRRLLPALAPLILLEGLYWVLRVTLFGLRRYRSIWIVAAANNLLKLIIVFALWRMNEGVVTLVVGIVAVQIVTVAGQMVLVLRFLPKGSSGADAVPSQRRIWKYVLPLLGANVFYLSGVKLNVLLLGALMPAREVGLASFALLTVERFIALAKAVPDALLPTLSRLRGEGREESIERVVTQGFRVVAALSVIMMAGIFLLAREAVWITGGQEFLGAIVPLQVLALVPLFRTTQQPLNMSLLTYERTRTVFWLAGLKFAVEPIAYLFLIRPFGVSGVALSNLLSSVIVFGPTSFIADRLFPKTTGARRRSCLTAWGIGTVVVIAGVAAHRLSEPWPGLLVRIGILIATFTAILLVGRMMSGDDLRRLASVRQGGRAERILLATAGWLDRGRGPTRRVAGNP